MIQHHNRLKFNYNKKKYVKFEDNIYKVSSWRKKTLVSILDFVVIFAIAIILWLIKTAINHELKNTYKVFKFIFNPDKKFIIEHGNAITLTYIPELKDLITDTHNLAWFFLFFLFTLLIWNIIIPSLWRPQTIFMYLFKIEIYDEKGGRTHAGKILIRELINNGIIIISAPICAGLLLGAELRVTTVSAEILNAGKIFIILFAIGIVWSGILSLISFHSRYYDHTIAELSTKTTIIDLKGKTDHIKMDELK